MKHYTYTISYTKQQRTARHAAKRKRHTKKARQQELPVKSCPEPTHATKNKTPAMGITNTLSLLCRGYRPSQHLRNHRVDTTGGRAVWGGGAPSWDPCAEKSGYRGSGWHRVIKSPTTPPREATLRMMRKVGRGTASGAGAALRCCCRQRRQLLLASMVMLSLLLEVLVLLMRRLLLGVAARRRERHLVVRERQRQLRLGRGLVS
ncbi:unnamed protein product [Ectocarpus fasciculatus]